MERGLLHAGTRDALVERYRLSPRRESRCWAAGLRICKNPECGWVFTDRSRTGRRKWCDMATCGNRAKVARHRARQRAVA